MGQVDGVPAGKYGKAALTYLGVWDAVSPRVAQAENVRAALAFVAKGRYRRASEPRTIRTLFEERGGAGFTCTLEEEWLMKYSRKTQIKLVGIFDTVGAVCVSSRRTRP